MGVPGTIINDDQRQIGGWIITSEPWAASAYGTHLYVRWSDGRTRMHVSGNGGLKVP
jgi:hypothetical protein